MLNIELRNQIKAHALENPSQEVCGLVLSSGDATLIYRCKNISQNKNKHFELSPLDYLRALDNGKNKILGFYHSQKSPKPSILDVINKNNHKLNSYIYSFDIDDFIEVTEKHFKYEKYLGKPFELNKQDCFTLLIDFYNQEMGVSIFNYPRPEGWFKKDPNIIENNYLKEGFKKIQYDELVEGDIIEFSYGHFGIYLDNSLLMHHPRNKFSNIEKINDVWRSRIVNCYRYKNE